MAQRNVVSGTKNSEPKTAAKAAGSISNPPMPKANLNSAHTNSPVKAKGQLKAQNAPAAVATPLPPLKPKNTGHMWPAATATAISATVSAWICGACSHSGLLSHSHSPSSVAKKPFRKSPKKVSAAAVLLPVRITLVAPGLPEP